MGTKGIFTCQTFVTDTKGLECIFVFENECVGQTNVSILVGGGGGGGATTGGGGEEAKKKLLSSKVLRKAFAMENWNRSKDPSAK